MGFPADDLRPVVAVINETLKVSEHLLKLLARWANVDLLARASVLHWSHEMQFRVALVAV